MSLANALAEKDFEADFVSKQKVGGLGFVGYSI